MLRRMTDEDVDDVGQIWLEASLIAHEFVSAEFWHADHEVMTSEILPGSHGYVHETDGKIDGFVILGSGKRSNYMGALFVSPQRQGQDAYLQWGRDTLGYGVYLFKRPKK